MKIGYTSGVFDMFHYGHEAYLKKCMERCDYLFVAVDSDLMVRTKKCPTRPIQQQSQRVAMVKTLCSYTFIKQRDSTFYKNIISPDVVFFPSNKEVTQSDIPEEVIIIPYTTSISTTKIIKASRLLEVNS